MAFAFWKYHQGCGGTSILLGARVAKRHHASGDTPATVEPEGYGGMRVEPVYVTDDDDRGAEMVGHLRAAEKRHRKQIDAAHADLRARIRAIVPSRKEWWKP